jgi:hypothetical protein
MMLAEIVYHCQYCGTPVHGRHVTRHERTCLDNPTVLAELRELLDDGTGRCIRRNLYMKMVYRPVASEMMVKRFGSWDATAVALGLAIPDKQPKTGWNAPLTDAERNACRLRANTEQAYYPSK